MNIKKISLFFMACIMLILYKPIFSMEYNASNKSTTNIGKNWRETTNLPSEISFIILQYIFMDSAIIDDARDIYTATPKIIEHLMQTCNNIFLVCRDFRQVKRILARIIKPFYINILIKNFLEYRNNGLYPQGDNWIEFEGLNIKIGNFLLSLITNKRLKSDSILHYIIDHNYCLSEYYMIRLFLFFGANSNALNNETHQNSVLLSLLKLPYPMLQTTKLLLYYKANPNLKNANGHTPLAEAALDGNKDLIKLLLQYNAEPDSMDKEGRTPLFWACKRGHYKIAKFLLKNGANPHTQTKLQKTISPKGEIEYHTPLSIAHSQGFIEIVELLEYYNKCFFTPKFCVIS